ncbi:tellurite resistance TerB family protein [Helicobacter cynogastricus]|uniref:hypothetical protein n=1 Tax=Helicobacter cynogastricus TaxID=329937 RepID=UPI000CF0483E|nr:hypothetical protein [Helicobacter cynogastricus]
MEVILVVAVAAVLIYLYYTLQNYLKNPLHAPSSTSPVSEAPAFCALPTPEEKLRQSEVGITTLLMAQVATRMPDSPLKKALIGLFLNQQEELKELYENSETPPLEDLCMHFMEVAHGEYKKRLKLVEFFFVLAYAPGFLQEEAKEALLDVGAFLKLENADFNALYDNFDQLATQKTYKVILAKIVDFASFQNQVSLYYLNFMDAKAWNKSYYPDRMCVLWSLQNLYNATQTQDS